MLASMPAGRAESQIEAMPKLGSLRLQFGSVIFMQDVPGAKNVELARNHGTYDEVS